MNLKDILATEKFGNLKAISDYNQHYLIKMIEAMNEENQNPYQFYANWVKSPIYNKVERSLLNDYSIEKIRGNKTLKLLPSSLLSFKLTDYIKSHYNRTIDFKKNLLLDYNYDTYQTLTCISIAMLINKYQPDTLYREHIIFVCIQVLLTYFTLYRGKNYLVRLSDVARVTDKVLKTEISVFDEISEKLNFKSYTYIETNIPRTLTKEQIDEFILPGDTQTEIKKKIMKWCPCGERKARYIMQEYGLTEQKYTRKDYRKESDKDKNDAVSP
jgi:hypothetical protein